MNIDGIDIEYLLVPGTEAPSEMMMWLPQFNVRDSIELLNPSIHNLCQFV